jgi:hypothetical protein
MIAGDFVMGVGCLRVMVGAGVVGLAAACAGCGVGSVWLQAHGVVEPAPANAPVTYLRDGRRTMRVQAVLAGSPMTLRYEGMLWRWTHLPCVRTGDGKVMMLDTGMLGVPLAVTLDVVNEGRRPAHLDPEGKGSFAYVGLLEISGMNVTNAPAWVQHQTFVVRVLGVPVYRASGWVMGDPLLRQAGYLAFDNGRREVTLGFGVFVPGPERRWQCFERGAQAFPLVEASIQGVKMAVLADSAGGEHLIVNPEQWATLERAVRVVGHWTDRYPTWGGFQKVDAYRVETLRVGSVVLERPTVWVRRGKGLEVGATLGLGMFKKEMVVWDYPRGRLWIGE